MQITRFTNLEFLDFKLGELIDSHVGIFRDRQDEGRIILTPIYLLIGCSLPVWLTSLSKTGENESLSTEEILLAMSGILSIGIGDTFASIGGTSFGKNRWQGMSMLRSRSVVAVFYQKILSIYFVIVILCSQIVSKLLKEQLAHFSHKLLLLLSWSC